MTKIDELPQPLQAICRKATFDLLTEKYVHMVKLISTVTEGEERDDLIKRLSAIFSQTAQACGHSPVGSFDTFVEGVIEHADIMMLKFPKIPSNQESK